MIFRRIASKLCRSIHNALLRSLDKLPNFSYESCILICLQMSDPVADLEKKKKKEKKEKKKEKKAKKEAAQLATAATPTEATPAPAEPQQPTPAPGIYLP